MTGDWTLAEAVTEWNRADDDKQARKAAGVTEEEWRAMEKPAPVWSEMDLAELHRSGLLWHINRAVMWPLGLAFAVERDTETDPPTYTRLSVVRVDPFEGITSGDSQDDERARAEALEEWMCERMGT